MAKNVLLLREAFLAFVSRENAQTKGNVAEEHP
jgi:hypothetical protein